MTVEVLLQLIQYGPLALVVYASMTGMVIWKKSHDAEVALLNHQLADKDEQIKQERERTRLAEENGIAMRNMLFESFGINKGVIAKLDVQSGGTPVPQVS